MSTTDVKATWSAPADSPRPFRLWDANAKEHVRGRNYGSQKRAHDGALLVVRWAKVGAALEVYDARTGRLCGQYIRKPTTIAIHAPMTIKE